MGIVLNKKTQGPIDFAPSRSNEPLSDFKLEHKNGPLNYRAIFEEFSQEWGGNIVRQIADDEYF